jgi:esterase/lipase superfamily enzyme
MSLRKSLGLPAVLISIVFSFVPPAIAGKTASHSNTVWYGIRLPSSVFDAGFVDSSGEVVESSDQENEFESHGITHFSLEDTDEKTTGVKNNFETAARRALIQLISGSVEIGSSEVKISGTAPADLATSIVETLKSGMPAGYHLTANVASSGAAAYSWSAMRTSDDTIELSGNVPDEVARRRLVAAAGHLVDPKQTNAVIDRLSVRQGAPTGFSEASFSALQQLRNFKDGVISLTESKIYVIGDTDTTIGDQNEICLKIVGYLPPKYSCGFIFLRGFTPHHHRHYRAGGGGGGSYGHSKEPHRVVNPAKVSTVVAMNPEDFDRRIVDLLFATNRQVTLDGSFPDFTGERGDRLSFGEVRIRVPDDHKAGHLELPHGFSSFWLDLTGRQPDPKVNFTVSSRQILTLEDWDAVISELKPNDALVFVHGFNMTFDDAAFRMAQIVWDLQYKGLPVLYSWPSRGEAVDYQYDRESALGSREGFIALLHNLRDKHGIARVHVLAHSMGNFLAVDALANESGVASPAKLASLVMAAPDVDKDQFVQAVPKIEKICGRMTLYASSADRALIISKTLAGAVPRAGDVPIGGPITLPGLESIDVTALGNEMFGLNHTVFATSRELINDINLLIVDGKVLPRLATERAVPLGSSAPLYWQYVP